MGSPPLLLGWWGIGSVTRALRRRNRQALPFTCPSSVSVTGDSAKGRSLPAGRVNIWSFRMQAQEVAFANGLPDGEGGGGTGG